MTRIITGRTVVAGVIGRPVAHSLSPIIHNAWLDAADMDAVYVALSPREEDLPRLLDGLRGGAVAGLNVTLPFKTQALSLADRASAAAQSAEAANVLVFRPDGIFADNTDGVGLLAAFEAQAAGFDPAAGPVAVLGAGGAARGAAAAFLAAGAPEVRLVNRTLSKAWLVATRLGAQVSAFGLDDAAVAFAGVNAIVNASSAALMGDGGSGFPLQAAPREAVVMDMNYKPLLTPLLRQGQERGMRTVDGLEMLIGQARPSYDAFFGAPPPATLDVRSLAIAAMEAAR